MICRFETGVASVKIHRSGVSESLSQKIEGTDTDSVLQLHSFNRLKPRPLETRVGEFVCFCCHFLTP